MSEIHAAIQSLERELEATQQRCHLIERAIGGLREIYGVTSNGDEPPKASRTNKQTSKQTKQAARRPAARSLPAAGANTRQAILAALKKGPMRPTELALAVGLKSGSALRYHIIPMEKSHLVRVIGNSNARMVQLPGTKPAKEVP